MKKELIGVHIMTTFDLQPNCSSLIVRLGSGNMKSIDTSTYPNGAMDIFWDIVDDKFDVKSIEIDANDGGDSGYIWRLVEFIKNCKRYNISREQAEELDSKIILCMEEKWEDYLYKHLDNRNKWHEEELPLEKRNDKLGQKIVMERL